MSNFAAAMLVLFASNATAADEFPKLPPPQKEHEWLQQLVGEWDSESEMTVEPGKPTFKWKGTESVRSLGGFWIVGENKATIMDKPMSAILTLGYDPEKKKYTGTWVDSHTSYMWKYVGTLDSAGKVLTLETEGPNPMSPGKMGKFRDVLEIKSKDNKVLSSSILGDDAKWTTFMTVDYRRKK